jgi:hypothetical protein
VNEVLNGFFRHGQSAPEGAAMGYLPSGTGSDFARTLEAFDERTGLRKYYDRGLADAFTSTLGVEKVGTGWSDDIDGEILTEKELLKAAASPKLGTYFGEAVKTAFAKDPVTIYESLPTPHKVIISQIARGQL